MHNKMKNIPKENLLTIREMCETFNITARALRFYEAKGLISPLRIGKKRIYSHKERVRVNLILEGKKFHFSLDEISELFDLYHQVNGAQKQYNVCVSKAQNKLEKMKKEAHTLNQTIKDLEILLENKEVKRLEPI